MQGQILCNLEYSLSWRTNSSFWEAGCNEAAILLLTEAGQIKHVCSVQARVFSNWWGWLDPSL